MSARFDILDAPIAGLRLLERKPVRDNRGYLQRIYCSEELQLVLSERNIVQINHTVTLKRGTVRGMHFQQQPHGETKLVSCLRGEVFDVAVDVRHGSPTFLHWHAETLSADNFRTLVIPAGFAHGFQTLVDNCELLYLHTAAYQPGSEDGFNARDPTLEIRWPLPISDQSARDSSLPHVPEHFRGVLV